MENLYYLYCEHNGKAVSYFDNTCDSMTSIRMSKYKNEWEKFTLEEAIEIRRHTNYEIVEVSTVN